MGDRRTRVHHLIHSSAFGGGPAMVELLCSRLHGDEFEMSVITSGDGVMPERLQGLGMRVFLLPLANKRTFLKNIPRLAGMIRRESPDLVHVHGHFAASLGQIAIHLAGRFPTLYSVQWPAYLDDTGPYSRARNWLAERLSCGLARRVVAVSEHDRQTLLRRRLCSPHKLTLIYNSYDPRRIDAYGGAGSDPSQHDLPRNGPVLGFVGRLADQKGCEILVRAMPQVLASHSTARLSIVGDGPERPRLEALVRELELESAVEFLGYQPVTAAVLDRMDALVVPSLYEPLGIVALEAMARGRPVVASAVGGLREVVEDEKTGLLVAAGNAHALAAAIIRLLDSPETGRAMGRAGQQMVRERFSPEACIAAYAAEYRAIIRP